MVAVLLRMAFSTSATSDSIFLHVDLRCRMDFCKELLAAFAERKEEADSMGILSSCDKAGSTSVNRNDKMR